MDLKTREVHINAMQQEILTFVLAAATFVGGHFILSSLAVRSILAEKIGVQGHRLLYSAVALGSFVWMLIGYGNAFAVAPLIWDLPLWSRMVPVFVMPFAAILVVCSLSTPLATAMGGDITDASPRPVSGIATITRHPMMVGVCLFCIAHLVANGDLASIILFGSLLILAVGGMLHLDHRREATMGGDWGPIALTTSIVPFAAAIQGRTSIDWRGIGPWRPLAGVALYAGLIYAHPWIAGIAIFPS